MLCAFYKQIQNLPTFEAFIARRNQITPVWDLLIAISSTHFTALHSALLHVSSAEKKLSADQWALFKAIYLAVPIQSLTACLNTENTPVTTVNLDAASYQSQKALAFLKPNANTPQINGCFHIVTHSHLMRLLLCQYLKHFVTRLKKLLRHMKMK